MIEAWWDAHKLEFLVYAVLIGIALCFVVPITVVGIVRERRQKRKDGLL